MLPLPNTRVERIRSSVTRLPVADRVKIVAGASIVALLVFTRGRADGKCGFEKYTIRATVLATGQMPLDGARLTFVVNDEPQPWLIHWQRNEPELYITDEAGRFSGTFYFSRASGAFLGMIDQCHRKFKKLAVVVTRQGYCSQRITLKPGQITWTELEDQSKVLNLPPVEMKACP